MLPITIVIYQHTHLSHHYYTFSYVHNHVNVTHRYCTFIGTVISFITITCLSTLYRSMSPITITHLSTHLSYQYYTFTYATQHYYMFTTHSCHLSLLHVYLHIHVAHHYSTLLSVVDTLTSLTTIILYTVLVLHIHLQKHSSLHHY